MSDAAHHPQISRWADGRWVVNCSECRRAKGAAVPIGIGLPVQSRHVAEMLRENHERKPARAAG